MSRATVVWKRNSGRAPDEDHYRGDASFVNVVHTTNTDLLQTDEAEFSLVAGGPIYQLFVRLHLGHEDRFPVLRRMVFVASFAWLPMLALTLAFPGPEGVQVGFLEDIYVHARFLIALPILLVAEPYVNHRLAALAHSFIACDIVRQADIPKFSKAITSAHRLRDSTLFELALVAVVYTFGLWFWANHVAFGVPTWYANPNATGLNLTPAGYWFVFISIPLVQFFTLRWYARFFVWFWLLRRVEKLDLNLVPTHPDRAAGLGFLARSTYAFSPILFAQGAVLSAFIASEVLYKGVDLLSFRVTAFALLIFFVVAAVSPLFVFLPALFRTKRRGLASYSRLASRYVNGFDDKWVKGIKTRENALLGTSDIQSLADLSNSFAIVKEMRFTPFGYQDLLRLGIIVAVPLLPLSLFALSLEEIVDTIMRIVF